MKDTDIKYGDDEYRWARIVADRIRDVLRRRKTTIYAMEIDKILNEYGLKDVRIRRRD